MKIVLAMQLEQIKTMQEELDKVIEERLKAQKEKVITNATAKQFYKSSMRKFYSINEPDAIDYLHNVVDYLLLDQTINYLKKMANYKVLTEYLKEGRGIYNRASQLRKQIEESEVNSEKRKRLESQMIQRCAQMPLTKITLIKVFFGLVSVADLSNISIPITTQETEKKRRFPMGSEGGVEEVNF